ncbi:hypothetical protein PCASD_12289 [Puccinia coronata f. sp. avenae]|uniref:Uncharacterized protein n=1 Tax=Puccinia coronata f. sp. avenae TaxID=200324 RepID=A0A2N5UR06_9BASI|nr:hypothetical protein PCASD_12289 [Puccinia coronata f. sp. avenae]
MAKSPAPGGHTLFSGIPPPFSSSAASAAGAISQQSHVYTQPGVKRMVHLDYVLYLRLVIADLIKLSRPSSSIAKKDKKEWEKYSLVGPLQLQVWLVNLLMYNLEKFKLEVITDLCNDQYHFRKFVELLISHIDLKWQAIIANSR